MRRLLILGGLVAVVLAAVVSIYASSQPDGLEKVAGDHGILEEQRDSAAARSPLAGYSITGVSDHRLGGAAAGLVGVAVTAAVGFGLFHVVRRRH
ncbi:MAG: PDGLE domain-containing protein [Candidatus Nanopelagicales bacterium]